jgi:hypothetical protein
MHNIKQTEQLLQQANKFRSYGQLSLLAALTVLLEKDEVINLEGLDTFVDNPMDFTLKPNFWTVVKLWSVKDRVLVKIEGENNLVEDVDFRKFNFLDQFDILHSCYFKIIDKEKDEL